MTEQDVKTIALEGFSDAMRKSPVVYAVVLEALAIAALAWWMVSDSSTERQKNSEYVQSLHSQLIQCHRNQK